MSNISTTTTLDVIYNLSTFKDRLEKLENESAKKGTTDGINHEIEYYANVANAVVYTATDFLTGAALEKFLKDYTDMLKISESLSEYTGNAIGNKVRSYLYDNINEFNTFNLPSPENTIPSIQIDNSTLFNLEKNIFDSWNNNFLSDNYYTDISKNITNYLINSDPSNDYSFTQDTTDTNSNPTTIFDLASQYNVSVSQLEAQNTWLKDRTSDSLPSVFNNSSYNTINIENNTGISYDYTYTYDDRSDSNQSGSINEDEIVQKVSFIKSKQI